MDIAIWYMFLDCHVGGDAPPDIQGYIGLALCLPGSAFLLFGNIGFLLAPFCIFIQHAWFAWWLIPKVFKNLAEDLPPNA